MTSDQDTINRVTRQGQIIIAALTAGVLVFVAMAVPVNPGIKPAAPGPAAAGAAPDDRLLDVFLSAPITSTAIGFSVMILPLSILVPRIITDRNSRIIAAGTWAPATPCDSTRGAWAGALTTDTGKIEYTYFNYLIVGAALNEAPAFFAAIAYIVEKKPAALGAALLLATGLLVRLPTQRSLELWIERREQKLHLER
jgi:hypothetical protein